MYHSSQMILFTLSGFATLLSAVVMVSNEIVALSTSGYHSRMCTLQVRVWTGYIPMNPSPHPGGYIPVVTPPGTRACVCIRRADMIISGVAITLMSRLMLNLRDPTTMFRPPHCLVDALPMQIFGQRRFWYIYPVFRRMYLIVFWLYDPLPEPGSGSYSILGE